MPSVDWARNPDVQELLLYNRQAKQARCAHQPMGPAWDAICAVCWKHLTWDEAETAYQRLEAAHG